MKIDEALKTEYYSSFSTAFFDIETTNLNADFGVVLCCGIKPAGKKPYILRLDQFSKQPWNDRKLITLIRDELEKYDIIIGYNSKMFDIRFLNSRLMKYGLRTIRRDLKHVDIYWQIRFKFKLHDSKLATACEHLGLEIAKTPLKGDYWIKAACGDKSSMNYVARHCMKDTEVLEQVFSRVKDLIKIIQ